MSKCQADLIYLKEVEHGRMHSGFKGQSAWLAANLI